jgi:hypothetical protein
MNAISPLPMMVKPYCTATTPWQQNGTRQKARAVYFFGQNTNFFRSHLNITVFTLRRQLLLAENTVAGQRGDATAEKQHQGIAKIGE